MGKQEAERVLNISIPIKVSFNLLFADKFRSYFPEKYNKSTTGIMQSI